MNNIQRAIQFAAVKHAGQVRKWTGTPYIEHPLSVMNKVNEYLPTHVPKQVREDMRISAVLHDTVEDTDATIEEIETLFGTVVASYVWYLTDSPKFIGDRAHRKNLDATRLSIAPNQVKVIKLFDFQDNAPTIRIHDQRFYQQFLLEKHDMFGRMNLEKVQFYGDEKISRFALV